MSNRNAIDESERAAALFRTLGQPARLAILQALRGGEACVCHMEMTLGYRQAYLSQHLMALREAGIVKSRREGRNIFYRIKKVEIIALLDLAGEVSGAPSGKIAHTEKTTILADCPCPHCASETGGVSKQTIPIHGGY